MRCGWWLGPAVRWMPQRPTWPARPTFGARPRSRRGCAPVRGWLGRPGDLPASVVRRVRTARRLRSVLAPVDEALTAGRIGWEHACVFDRAANPRIVEQIVELCPELIGLAEAVPFDRWRLEVRGIVGASRHRRGLPPRRG